MINLRLMAFSLPFYFISASTAAAEEISLSRPQIQALGITSAQINSNQPGVLAGIPAQVVIPGNQLFIVSTPMPAMVEQTLAGIGDQVTRGQPLARLQSPALAEAQRGLLQASTQAKLAHDNLMRDEQLWKDGIISESRYRTAMSHHMEAAAALAERKQLLRLSGMSDESVAKLESGNSLNSLLIVTSPITGVILEKSVDAGQRLEAATPLFKVARLQPLGLEIQAPLSNTHGIKVGAEVSIPSASAKGKITAVGQSLSNSNQTVLIRALIHQGAQALRPGQFVEASITTASKGGPQWSVPNSALIRLEGKSLVFVETGNGFRPVPVSIQQEGSQTSVISGNLNSNDKIAVSGISALKARLMGIGGGE